MVDFVLTVAAYFLGGISTGYYLVKLWRKEDIRLYGSGSTGATNVGRILGRKGFFLTLIGDALKGAFVPALALYWGLSSYTLFLSLIAVVAGHIWPSQLGFRGGKGVAPALGGILVLDPMLAINAVVVFLLVLAIIRKFAISGLIVILSAPIVSLVMERPLIQSVGLFVLGIIILIAHRDNVLEVLKNPPQRRK